MAILCYIRVFGSGARPRPCRDSARRRRPISDPGRLILPLEFRLFELESQILAQVESLAQAGCDLTAKCQGFWKKLLLSTFSECLMLCEVILKASLETF